MTDKSLPFSGQMVRALIASRKTQTRRILRPVKGVTVKDFEFGKNEPDAVGNWGRLPRDKIKDPAYAVGDLIWVREMLTRYGEGTCHYPADDTGVWAPPGIARVPDGRALWPWKVKTLPSIYCPRWASRFTLRVEHLRVQRLQDISEDDAAAEGIGEPYLSDADPPFEEQAVMVSRRQQFRNLWNELHGLGAWQSNPWVVAIGFSKVEKA